MNDIIDNSKFKTPVTIILIGVFAILIRLIYIFNFVDIKNIDTWEYGAIAENISNNQGYSLFYYDNNVLSYKFQTQNSVFPSAYMPPLYPLIITPIYKTFTTTYNRNIAILILNCVFDFFTIIFLYLSFKNYKKFSISLVLIFAIFPPFILASSKVGVSSLFFTIMSIILYLFYLKKGKILKIILLSLLALLRSEFLIFPIILILLEIFNRNYRLVLFYTALLLTIQAPWIIRNYVVFNNIIIGTTSLGINFYRGHNPYYQSAWGDERTGILRDKLLRDNNFEMNMNSYYFKEAIHNIKTNSSFELILTFQKIGKLFIIDLTKKNYVNFSISIFFWLILFISIKEIKFFKFNSILILFNLIIGLVFFVIPRYQVYFYFSLLPFITAGLLHITTILKERTFSFSKMDEDLLNP